MKQIKHSAVMGVELALAFQDGTEIYLPLAMLRRACPCAVCQGEPDALGRVIRPKVEYGAGSFDLLKFAPVGGYALQLHWADGHNSGIYSFDYLMKLAAMAKDEPA